MDKTCGRNGKKRSAAFICRFRYRAISFAGSFRQETEGRPEPLSYVQRDHPETGGIILAGRLATMVVKEPRIHLPGYGPSASTIGANRAGLVAARELMATLGLAERISNNSKVATYRKYRRKPPSRQQ